MSTIFKTFGQEIQSYEITSLPGYAELTEEVRKQVTGVYEQTYTARKHLGTKIAQGQAFEAAASAALSEAKFHSLHDTIQKHGFAYKGTKNGFRKYENPAGHEIKHLFPTTNGNHSFHHTNQAGKKVFSSPNTGDTEIKQHLDSLKEATKNDIYRAVLEGSIVLDESTCKTCGRQMKEVRSSNATHKFCPVCNPKSLGYGEKKRMKEDDSASMQHQNVEDKESAEDKGKFGEWGTSPSTPPDTSSEPSGDTSLGLQKKNHSAKGLPESEWGEPKDEEPGSYCGESEVKKPKKELTAGSLWKGLGGKPKDGKKPVTTKDLMKMAEPYKKVKESTLSGQDIMKMALEQQLFEDAVTGAIKTAQKNGYKLAGAPKQSNIGMSFKLTHPEGHSLSVQTGPSGIGWSHTHKNGARKTGTDPNTLASHLSDVDEAYVGFKKLKGELAHKKGVTNPGALAAYIGKKKYGAKDFNTHKHMDEAEVNETEVDAHGNRRNPINKSHASYKAGHRYGNKLAKSSIYINDPKGVIHSASAGHLRDTHGGATLQAKLDAQRHFKAAAHAAFKKHTGLSLDEDSSKDIQSKNFEEKCDFCGKMHAAGPCPMISSPAMQENDSQEIQKENLKKVCKDCDLMHDPDVSCEDAKKDLEEDEERQWQFKTPKFPPPLPKKMKESEWKVDSPAYPASGTPEPPPSYECGGDWDGEHASKPEVEEGDADKDLQKKNREDKGLPVNEREDDRICYCGHVRNQHGPDGCKSCRKEGYSKPDHANHQFRLNSTVKMEHVDPLFQAAVDHIAAQFNISKIAESASPRPKLNLKDKFSNFQMIQEKTVSNWTPLKEESHETQDPTHKRTAYNKTLGEHGFKYHHTDQGEHGKWHRYVHASGDTADTFHHDTGHHAWKLTKKGDKQEWMRGNGKKTLSHWLGKQ